MTIADLHCRARVTASLEREGFNCKLWDELLNRKILYSLREAQILVEGWRRHYDAIRPHSALRWGSPAPEVRLPEPRIYP